MPSFVFLITCWTLSGPEEAILSGSPGTRLLTHCGHPHSHLSLTSLCCCPRRPSLGPGLCLCLHVECGTVGSSPRRGMPCVPFLQLCPSSCPALDPPWAAGWSVLLQGAGLGSGREAGLSSCGAQCGPLTVGIAGGICRGGASCGPEGYWPGSIATVAGEAYLPSPHPRPCPQRLCWSDVRVERCCLQEKRPCRVFAPCRAALRGGEGAPRWR